MPRNGGAAAQPTLSAEQLEQLKAFVQGALEAEDEERLLEVLGHFKPRFLMLGADSPEGEQLRGALKVMAYNMEAMQLTDTTLAKSKRLFVGNADLLPDCVRTWQRLRDAPEPVPPQAAAAAVTTPKLTKVELELAAAVSSGLLAEGFTEGKLKEAAKRLESTGAPSLSLRAVIRFAGGNWVSEPKTPGLPGAKEHGFLRAAWRDARQEFPNLEPTQVLLIVWAAIRHFMVEVCQEDLVDDLGHLLWLTETQLLYPLVALSIVPEKVIDLLEKHCFERFAVVLARHRDASDSEELEKFSSMIEFDMATLKGEVARQARTAHHAGAHGGSHDDAEFAVIQAASGLLLPFSIAPGTANQLRQDNICPLDLIADKLCPMGMGCQLGHFVSSADREAAVADTRYGLTAAIRALRGRLHGVSRDMAPGDLFSAAPRARAPSPDASAKPRTGGSYASAAAKAKRPTHSKRA